MRRFLLAVTMLATTANAAEVSFDAWGTQTQGDSRIIYNLNANNAMLSLNCKDASFAWLSINDGDNVYLWPQNEKELEITDVKIVTTLGDTIDFKQDDLDFWELNMALGQHKLQNFVNVLAKAALVQVTTSDKRIYDYNGTMPTSVKSYQDVSAQCKIKN